MNYEEKYKQALERAVNLFATNNISAIAACEIFPELNESEEINYEKKYKKALERMKSWAKGEHPECFSEAQKAAEFIFPELKKEESEDERIRKALIEFFGEQCDMSDWNGVYGYQVLAWLEKQDKLDNNDTDILNRFSFYSYKDEPNILYLSELYVNKEQRNRGIGTKILKIADKVAVEMKYNLIRLKTEIGSNAERLYKKNGYNFLKMEGNQVWLEKQGENKHTDKVEPKFKVGDWVLNNVCYPMQIASIKDGMYVFTEGDAMSVSFVDEHLHLWSIQDAEDGDVLCYHVSSTTFFLIGIFKRVAHKDELWGGTYRNYAQYGGYGSIENYTLQVALGNDELHHCGSIACPATKEQRDLLFQKMKEAGYEWDADKKELKKIEPKKLDMTREEFRDKKSKDYRKHREAYGINNPVYLDEIEEAYYQGMVDADSHPHWISVEDELPIDYEPVLAVVGGKHFAFVGICLNKKTWYCEIQNKAIEIVGITHWMHLPQPPSSSEKPNNCEKGSEE